MYTIGMKWIVFMALVVGFELVADFFAQSWAMKSKPFLAVISISVYVLVNIFWLISLRSGSGLARGTLIFSVSSAILTVGLGVFYFKETLTIHQGIGLALGVLALGFLFWE